jgi:hypothetical protein
MECPSVILLWLVSIGTNAILYSVIGAVVLIWKSSFQKSKVTMDELSGNVKLISVIYAMYAVVGLFGIPLFLGDIYGPALINLLNDSYQVNILPVAGILNAMVCALIAYGFLKFRYWNIYLTISYNVIWLGALIVGFVLSRIVGPSADIGYAFMLSVAFLIFPLSVIRFCSRSDVKKLMA